MRLPDRLPDAAREIARAERARLGRTLGVDRNERADHAGGASQRATGSWLIFAFGGSHNSKAPARAGAEELRRVKPFPVAMFVSTLIVQVGIEFIIIAGENVKIPVVGARNQQIFDLRACQSTLLAVFVLQPFLRVRDGLLTCVSSSENCISRLDHGKSYRLVAIRMIRHFCSSAPDPEARLDRRSIIK